MEFRLLGPLEVRHDEHILKLGGPRQQAVLAALALSTNRVVSIGHLTQAVWERAPASPASNLRTYVLGLRRRLRAGGERIQRLLTRPPGYLLRAEAGEVDVLLFDQLADRGSRALATGALPEATACLRYALALWRGEPCEGLPLGAELRAETVRLQERRLIVVERYVDAQLAAGEPGEAIGELRPLVVRHPLRESLWRQLILALYRAGRPGEATDAYHAARHQLVDQLGVEPGEELRRLHAAVLTADPALRGPDRRG
jgi:DNA-binding SARP family transcriptional activator